MGAAGVLGLLAFAMISTRAAAEVHHRHRRMSGLVIFLSLVSIAALAWAIFARAE